MPWVILIGILLLLELLSRVPIWAYVLVLLPPLSYGLYHLILSSDWVDRIHRDHKRQLENTQREERAQLIRQDWETTIYQLPTEDQFRDAVTARYKEGKTRYLREQFLWPLSWAQGRIYTNSGISKKEHSVAETIRFHDQLTSAALQGLDRFTRAAPDAVLTTAAEEDTYSYLMLKRTLPQLLNTDDPAEMLLDAYWELAQPMEDALFELQKYGLFHNQSFGPDPLSNQPASIDDRMWDVEKTGKEPNVDSIRKQYERDKEKYDKATKERDDELPPIARAVRGTPYWDYKTQLIPSDSYHDAFDIKQETRFSGTWIIAPQGKGKTNLLHHMIADDRRKKCTIVLMDSKGDMINPYRGMPDVVIIDYKTANINPLQLGSSNRSMEFIEYILAQLLDTTMTGKQKSLFRSILTVLMKTPDATLETFRQVLTVGWKPLNLEPYILKCDQITQDFFFARKPAEFDSPQYAETKREVLWRLRLILSNDYLRAIFTSPTTNVPFSEYLDSGKTIIIDNSKNDLGEEGAEFFGRFFVAIVWMTAVSRSRLREEDKMPVFFYIDEAQTVIARDEKVGTIILECRSQKIAMILAHQNLTYMTGDKVKAALADCAIKIANCDDDAPALASKFGVKADALQLPTHSFAFIVRDKNRSAVTIEVPWFDRSQFPPPPEPLPVEPLRVAEPVAVPEPAVATPTPPTEKQARKKGR